MHAFAHLFALLDGNASNSACLAALARYFRQVPAADAAWAVRLLTGPSFERLVSPRTLAQWAAQMAQIPDWMLEACYQKVGNLVETATLLLPPPSDSHHQPLHIWLEDRLPALQNLAPQDRFQATAGAWAVMDRPQRHVWNLILTGTLALKSADVLVTKALARVAGLEPTTIHHRLAQPWKPGAFFFERLVDPQTQDTHISRPYPFCAPPQLERPLSPPGRADRWQAEWQWPGKRVQVIQRQGQVFIWNRQDNLITDRFPEIGAAAADLPDGTVVEGLLLAWPGHCPHPLPAAELARRLNGKRTTAKLLRQVPAVLVAYDLLEDHYRDLRARTLLQRRADLQRLLTQGSDNEALRLMPAHALTSWDQGRRLYAMIRLQGARGLILKKRQAAYGAREAWLLWPPQSLTVTALLVYAQPGPGRGPSVYTFALRQADRLVPVAKTNQVADEAQMQRIDQYVKAHTHQRHGPVR